MSTVGSGVNVVGYHRQALGLGSEARRVVGLLRAAGVAVSTIDAPGSGSPLIERTPPSDNEWRHKDTLSIVAGDQLESVMTQLGESNFSRGRHTGMWYWELERINVAMKNALAKVDRLVAGSDYIWKVLARDTYRPVFRLPLTRPSLTSIPYGRDELDLPSNRLIFLCTFDFFSVIARKNPIGAVESFKKAFAEDEGPLLIVKSQNGTKLPDDLAAVQAAIGSRSDIRLIDQTFTDERQSSLLHNVDLLVSLHRAEGLGLHLLEALLRGVPVLATGYSAPWEFLSPANALPVDYGMIPVENGNGVYPNGSLWADPDIEHAAWQMKRFTTDSALRTRLARDTAVVSRRLTPDTEAGALLRDWLIS